MGYPDQVTLPPLPVRSDLVCGKGEGWGTVTRVTWSLNPTPGRSDLIWSRGREEGGLP